MSLFYWDGLWGHYTNGCRIGKLLFNIKKSIFEIGKYLDSDIKKRIFFDTENRISDEKSTVFLISGIQWFFDIRNWFFDLGNELFLILEIRFLTLEIQRSRYSHWYWHHDTTILKLVIFRYRKIRVVSDIYKNDFSISEFHYDIGN